jgi:hypothetical protein
VFPWSSLHILGFVQTTDAPQPSPSQPSPEGAVSPPARPSNYLMRHWYGELSLPQSYWVNGSLIGIALSIAAVGLARYMQPAGYSLRSILAVSLVFVVLVVTFWIWSLVGIWRSAHRHITEGKGLGWARTAKVMVAIGALSMIAKLGASTIPRVIDEIRIVSGHDPIGSLEIKLASGGHALILKGGFGAGTAEDVKSFLDAAPAVRTVELDSFGGRLLEVERLAAIVRERHLATYVEGTCASACTYVFLAGEDRAATPNAKIGFHKPSSAGIDDVQEDLDAVDRMSRIYRDDGIPEAFIQHAVSTPAESMWYPSRDELIRANVITRVSLGNEVDPADRLRSKEELFLAFKQEPVFMALERRFPGSMEKAVNSAWSARERGGSFSEAMDAGRSVISGKVPAMLSTASPDLLLAFVRLLLEEMGAARAVSAQACARYMDGTLNPTQVMSAEVNQDDRAFMLRILTDAPITPSPVSAAEMDKLLGLIRAQIPPGEFQVVAKKAAEPVSPPQRCDAYLHFFDAVNRLPENEKITVLRGLYQRRS